MKRWSGWKGPKPITQYEAEAVRKGACLIHPSSRVARKVYQKRHGVLTSSSVFVCHKCDNPQCIEDKHHFLGTAADNSADCKKKGRMKAAHNRPEVRKRRSEALLAYYNKPGIKQKHRADIVNMYATNPNVKNKQRKAALRRYADPEERLRNKKLQKIAQAKPEVRKKHSDALLGKPKSESHKRALKLGWKKRKLRLLKLESSKAQK